MSALEGRPPSSSSSPSAQRSGQPLDQSSAANGAAAPPAAGANRTRGELRTMLMLAGPVILGEIGWMTMGIVDTLMVGPLGPQAIGAAGLGSSVFLAMGIFGMGLLLGLDTLVSQAFGARRLDECHRWLFHGVALALLLTVPVMLLVWGMVRALDGVGLHPQVLPLAKGYVTIINYSTPALLLYAAFRRYLQGMGVVTPVMFALVSANIVNAVFNWMLIYGRFGFPAMGTDGAAWATMLSRLYMAGVLLVAIVRHDRRFATGLRTVTRGLEAARMKRLVRLGLPAASQITLEVGGFSAATVLAGKLLPASLAAHQIALNIAAFTFMVPLGMASAAAVLVGQAVGRGDGPGAARAGWMALGLICVFMGCTAVTFLAIPRLLLGPFTTDAAVLSTGAALLAVAAVFQLSDGLQVTSTGVLRGVGDTRTPMVSNLIGHWAIGLPVGWWCCFRAGWGVVGLWIGLSVGLTLVAAALLLVWARTARALRQSVSTVALP